MFRRVILSGGLFLIGTGFLAAQDRPAAKRIETPGTWGSATGFTTLLSSQFQPGRAGEYELFNASSQGSACVGIPTSECLGYAQIQVPDGARLEALDLWGYDVSADSDMHYNVIENCETSAGDYTEVVLDANDLAQSAGDFHYSSSDLGGAVVNNAQCGYTVRVKFTDSGEPPRGSDIRLRKVRVSWTRQVSPAPEGATFDDVPTDHPFFQFVEALAKSQITGGCGNGNYCPDAPLTRGQMAVFLAKGLGLQWP
jgi:hypothetical protein